MFENTGDMSFVLGLGFIVVALIGVAIAYIVTIKKWLKDPELEKLIGLFKWLIISVALVVGATIVTDSFKERDQDVEEIAVFEKYVETITAADGIEKRWLLAEYFSNVAPPGELRKSWVAYRKTLRPSLENYRKNKEKLTTLVAKEDPTDSEKKEIAELQDKTQVLEEKLVKSEQTAEEWVIIAGGDKTIGEAKGEVRKLEKIGLDGAIYKKGNMYRTVVPHFGSKKDAYVHLSKVRTNVEPTSYVVSFSGWCLNPTNKGQYLECG